MTTILNSTKIFLKDVLSETSTSIKFLLISTLLCFPVSTFFPSVLDIFAVRVTIILPPKFWVWTLLSYPFFESNLLALIFGLFTLLLASKLLEPLWGQKEFAKFLAITTIFSGLLSGLFFLILYCVTLNENLLYGRYLYGLAAIKGAILVGFKQTRGEDFVVKTPMISIQINSIPFLSLLSLWIIQSLTTFISTEYCTLFTAGMYSAWFYLRFYQHHPRGQGDLSDLFALENFFPKPINRFIKVASLLCWQIVTRFGCFKRIAAQTANTNLSSNNVTINSVDNFEAERRRQRALQELNDRLTKTENLKIEKFEEEDGQQKEQETGDLKTIPTEVVIGQ